MISLVRLRQILISAILFALPFERIPSLDLHTGGQSITVRISQVLGVILIGITLPLLWRRRRELLRSPWVWLVVFNFIALLSALQALELKRAILVFIYTAFVSVLAWTLATTEDSRQLDRYLRWLLIGALVASLVAVYQFFGDLLGLKPALTGLRLEYTKAVFGFPRIQSTSLEPLYFADYLLIPTALVATKFIFDRKRYGWLLLLFLTLICMALARGGYLGAGVVLVVVGIAGLLHHRAKRVAALAGITVAAVALAIGMIALGTKLNITHNTTSSGEVKRFTQQSTNFNEGVSVVGRTLTRNLAVSAFKAHPVLGIGPGNFGYYAHQHRPDAFPDNTGIVNNEPFEILAEEGTLGLLAILAFAVAVAWLAVKRLRSRTEPATMVWILGLSAALLGIVAQYQTFSTLYITHIWVAIGLLIGLLYRGKAAQPRP